MSDYDPERGDSTYTLRMLETERFQGLGRGEKKKHTSTQVTFWRVLEAILPVEESEESLESPAMVARARDKGAFASRDICMQAGYTAGEGEGERPTEPQKDI